MGFTNLSWSNSSVPFPYLEDAGKQVKRQIVFVFRHFNSTLPHRGVASAVPVCHVKVGNGGGSRFRAILISEPSLLCWHATANLIVPTTRSQKAWAPSVHRRLTSRHLSALTHKLLARARPQVCSWVINKTLSPQNKIPLFRSAKVEEKETQSKSSTAGYWR